MHCKARVCFLAASDGTLHGGRQRMHLKGRQYSMQASPYKAAAMFRRHMQPRATAEPRMRNLPYGPHPLLAPLPTPHPLPRPTCPPPFRHSNLAYLCSQNICRYHLEVDIRRYRTSRSRYLYRLEIQRQLLKSKINPHNTAVPAP